LNNPDTAAALLDCSSPHISIILDIYQSTCCGGESNHKDICPDSPEPYEAVCTTEEAFQANEIAYYSCNGNNKQACENAGYKYNEDDLECENVGITNRTECNQITDFNSVPKKTCGEFGVEVYAELESDDSDICTDPLFIENIGRIQSTCCGGMENHKEICADSPKPYEAICTSEEDFKANEILGYSCYGSSATACTDAGGDYDDRDGGCYDIDSSTPDACDAINGFTSISETCEGYGRNLNNPEANSKYSEFLDCDENPYGITQVQSRCCGGTNNNNIICPDVPIITPADVCNKCDENPNEDGVSDDCFDILGMMLGGGYELVGTNEVCPEEPENGSDINVECKAAILTGFGCFDTTAPTTAPTSVPTSAPTSVPISTLTDANVDATSSASDISNVLAVMIPTALLLCWTHL